MSALDLEKSLSDLSNTKWFKLFGMLLGCLGMAYLGWKFVEHWSSDIDFKYIWLSGNLWNSGQSPYSGAFMEHGPALFEVFNNSSFFYPPNWWLFSTFFNLFEYQFAVDLWRCINVALLISSSLLLKASMRQVGVNISWAYLVFYTGMVCFMKATTISMAFGQTGVLMYFAVSLIIYATLCNKQILLVVGFCLILLKPHIGIALLAAYAPFKIYRPLLIYSSALTLIMSLPALIPFGILKTIIAYIDGLSKYATDIVNNPQSSSGLKNVFHFLTNIELSGIFITFLAITCVFTFIMFFKYRGLSIINKAGSEKHIIVMMLSVCIICVLVPLHTYDIIVIAPLVMLASKFNAISHWLFSILFLFICRAENLATATGFYSPGAVYFFGGLIVTMAVFGMLILIIMQAQKLRIAA